MIKVLLIEGDIVVREHVKAILKDEQQLKIVAEVSSGSEVIHLLEKNFIPDLVMSEWSLPDSDGLNWIRPLKQKNPAVPIILFTMLSDENNIRQAFQMGISGYLLRNIRLEELIFAINHVLNGGIYLSSELTHQLIKSIIVDKDTKHNLKDECIFSKQELMLLQALADGLTNQQIGEKVFLSTRSIETHRAQLIKKAGVKNTAALIKYALMGGLIN